MVAGRIDGRAVVAATFAGGVATTRARGYGTEFNGRVAYCCAECGWQELRGCVRSAGGWECSGVVRAVTVNVCNYSGITSDSAQGRTVSSVIHEPRPIGQFAITPEVCPIKLL